MRLTCGDVAASALRLSASGGTRQELAVLDFQKEFGDGWAMDKQEHGPRLKGAMSLKGYGRKVVADAVGVDVKTVTNWTSGATLPNEADREALRRLFPGYDAAGDPVEVSLRASRLTEDRQYDVIGYYKRKLREQDEEAERGRSA